MKKIFLIVLSCLFISFGTYAESEKNLDPEVYAKVVSSVFEVVREKKESANITYEKELPLDRLPYLERTDKYTSIGSAFLLTDGKFYTAAHVLPLYGDTIFTDFYIRDSDGEVYKIKDILSFASNRDFVVFSVEGFEFEEGMGLSTTDKLKTGSTVYSVGNALGEGVVIRSGVYTSKTPENLNGEWKWLRFSAPASPGNSGGALINASGEVTGIITMKSANENLNYALPISEALKAKENFGLVKTQFYYRVPNLSTQKFYHEFKAEMTLPKTFSEVHEYLTKEYENDIKKTVDDIRKEYQPDAPKSFNKVLGKAEFFFNSYNVDYPHVIYLDQSGKWDFGSPSNMQTFQLEDKGSVTYGAMMNYYFATITKPESITLEELLSSPKKYMDYAIQATDLSRNVANEQIKITSLGEPSKQDTYVDYFGRTWYVNYFDADFADSLLISYSLPLPDGIFVMYSTASRESVTSSIYLDMAFVADYVYVSYSGKIKNWKEYLALPDTLNKKSDFEKAINIQLKDNSLLLETDKVSLDIPNEDFKADEEAVVRISTSFAEKDGKIVAENRGVLAFTDPAKENYRLILLSDYPAPMSDATESTTQVWSKILNKVPPLDGQAYTQEQITYLNDLVFEYKGNKKTSQNVILAHQCLYQISGATGDSEIKSLSEKVQSLIKFKK